MFARAVRARGDNKPAVASSSLHAVFARAVLVVKQAVWRRQKASSCRAAQRRAACEIYTVMLRLQASSLISILLVDFCKG